MAEPPGRWSAWLPCAAALVSVALMLPGIGEPFGGFLGYSEAWYTLVARSFERGSLLLPEVAPGRPDFNIPPLFAWLLHAAFSLAGPGEAVARAVAIAGAALGVVALGRAHGPAAAFLFASSPAWVLVGRNVQPDGWALGLALVAWATWRRGASRTAGVAFAAALLMKPTVLVLPFGIALAATLERRGLGWLERRHGVGAAIALAPSLVWAGLQLTLHRAAFLAGLRHGEGAFEWPTPALLPVLASEIVFAGFPVVAVLAALALPRLRHEPGLRQAAVLLGTGIALFAVMHYHGYYLVAFLPAAVVLAASGLDRRPLPCIGLVAVNAAAALILLAGHKLGRGEVAELARAARGATFVLTPEAWDAQWTLFALYGEPRALRSGSCVTARAGELVVRVPPIEAAAELRLGRRAPRALALGGWALAERPENPHLLSWGPLELRPAAGRVLGLVPLPSEVGAAASVVPAGSDACP